MPREVGLGVQGDELPGDYAPLARLAEGYGIDVLSVYADFLYQPAIGPLLEMATATERVRLGPAGLNPYTMHPYEIAGQIALLDMASRGRAYLGMVPRDMARRHWDHPVRAGCAPRRCGGGGGRAPVAGEQGGVAGEVFRLEPRVALRYERFRERVPLMIGSWGPRTLALAGEIADEVKIGGSANPAMVSVVRDRVARNGSGVALGGRRRHRLRGRFRGRRRSARGTHAGRVGGGQVPGRRRRARHHGDRAR